MHLMPFNAARLPLFGVGENPSLEDLTTSESTTHLPKSEPTDPSYLKNVTNHPGSASSSNISPTAAPKKSKKKGKKHAHRRHDSGFDASDPLTETRDLTAQAQNAPSAAVGPEDSPEQGISQTAAAAQAQSIADSTLPDDVPAIGPSVLPPQQTELTPPAGSSSATPSIHTPQPVDAAAPLEPDVTKLREAALAATIVTAENEDLIKQYHPAFEGCEVSVFTHPELAPVWVVTSGTSPAPHNWLTVAGRTVHLFNQPWLLPPTTHSTASPPDPLHPTLLNPRHLLSDAATHLISTTFPGALGCRVHLSGHLVLLYRTAVAAATAAAQPAPLLFGGLRIMYTAATPRPLPDTGSFGLRIRVPGADHDVLTYPTHQLVTPPPRSLWDSLRAPLRGLRYALGSNASWRRAAGALGVKLLDDTALAGRAVRIPGFAETFVVETCYDAPASLRPFPAGYPHDLCLLRPLPREIPGSSQCVYPDTSPAPGVPRLVGFHDHEHPLATQQGFFACSYDGNEPMLNQALVEATGYKWDENGTVCKMGLYWRTVGVGGNVLCVGDMAGGGCRAVVFASVEVGGGADGGRALRGGYVLPVEVLKGGIVM